MKVLAINGSPRRKGNTSHLLTAFLNGAQSIGAETEEVIADQLNIDHCRGCLRCNLIKRCAVHGDDWADLSRKILKSDTMVVASPIYFHHLSAPLKKIIDRFRSFVHIRITETGLIHTPWQQWKKRLVLILSQGSPSPADARPVEELFQFLHEILGLEKPLIKVLGTRLAMVNQVSKDEAELRRLYLKLGLPDHLVRSDFQANQALLERCYRLGRNLQ